MLPYFFFLVKTFLVKTQRTESRRLASVYSGNPGFGERVRHDRLRFPLKRPPHAKRTRANLPRAPRPFELLALAVLAALTIGATVNAKADDHTDGLKKFQETQVQIGRAHV